MSTSYILQLYSALNWGFNSEKSLFFVQTRITKVRLSTQKIGGGRHRMRCFHSMYIYGRK